MSDFPDQRSIPASDVDSVAERLAEQILVLRCQMGHEDAFEALYDRYSDRLLYYPRRLLGATGRAEDVLQEVWLTVYRRVATLENLGVFKAWLFRVAHNRAVGILRKSGRFVSLDEPTVDELAILVGTDEGPTDEGISDEDVARVHAALDRISPAHREVLTLRFLGELSYAEIASVLGCALGTVKSRIHHGKAALRAAIEEVKDTERGAPADGGHLGGPMLLAARPVAALRGAPRLAAALSTRTVNER